MADVIDSKMSSLRLFKESFGKSDIPVSYRFAQYIR